MLSSVVSIGFWYKQTLGYAEFGLPEAFCKVYYLVYYFLHIEKNNISIRLILLGNGWTTVVTSLNILMITFYRLAGLKNWKVFEQITSEKIKVHGLFAERVNVFH